MKDKNEQMANKEEHSQYAEYDPSLQLFSNNKKLSQVSLDLSPPHESNNPIFLSQKCLMGTTVFPLHALTQVLTLVPSVHVAAYLYMNIHIHCHDLHREFFSW